MRKHEIEAIIAMNKRRHSATILEAIHGMESMEADREQCKSMFFWTPRGNAAQRRKSEEWLSRDYSIELKGITIRYKRRVSESCKHVYATDWLYGALPSGEEVKMTLADLHKLEEGFKNIINNRKERETDMYKVFRGETVIAKFNTMEEAVEKLREEGGGEICYKDEAYTYEQLLEDM